MATKLQRRKLLLTVAALAAVGAAYGVGAGLFSRDSNPVSLVSRAAAAEIEVYKSPTCGCCTKWLDHLKAAGFTVTAHDTNRMLQVKKMAGVPESLHSCHTARVGDYIIEGHVPAKDIMRLLKEKPKARGLAVPGMVVGSPGMEVPGEPAEPYQVILFGENGARQVYAQY